MRLTLKVGRHVSTPGGSFIPTKLDWFYETHSYSNECVCAQHTLKFRIYLKF